MNSVSNIKEIAIGVLGPKISLTVKFGEDDEFFTVRMTKQEALAAAQKLQQEAEGLPDL